MHNNDTDLVRTYIEKFIVSILKGTSIDNMRYEYFCIMYQRKHTYMFIVTTLLYNRTRVNMLCEKVPTKKVI